MARVAKEKVIGNGAKQCCGECGKIKPYSEFYTRPMYGTPEKPAIEDGHFVSECIECMRVRGRKPKLLAPWESRVPTEHLAINYLMSRGIWTTTGKMTNSPWVDVVSYGVVWIEIKSASLQHRGWLNQFQFTPSPAQMKHGFRAHVVMLICEYDALRSTYHLFNATDPYFYREDGKMKTGFTFTPDEFRKSNAGKIGYRPLTQQIMDNAQDNTDLIADWVLRIRQALCDGKRPEYGKPFAR